MHRFRSRWRRGAWSTLSAGALAGAAALTLFVPGAEATGRCGTPPARPWCDTTLSPDARAELLLRVLTPAERTSLLAGDELTGALGGPERVHTGTSRGVPRVGLPTVYFADGPAGPRQGTSTAMPAPIAVAASFDPANADAHAAVVADETRKKGNDFVFGPSVNIQRTPLNGRTFEYFGEDPFLTSRMAVAWTKGVQGRGVIANVKHFAVNNQEGVKAPFDLGDFIGVAGSGSRFTVNAIVDERALREIYLRQFEAAVTEGQAGSVMCAYPRVNGRWACENPHLLTGILKGEWRFPGFVLTDYGANHSTDRSLNAGLDLDIWPGFLLQPWLVNLAVGSGNVQRSTIDEAVGRQLRTLFAFGAFDRGAYRNDVNQIDRAAHNAAAADVAARGVVLLRNEGGVLPLSEQTIKRVAVIGPEATVLRNGGGSSAVNAFRRTTPLAALQARLGADRVRHSRGTNLAASAAVARAADVAIVVVGDKMTEGFDKPCLALRCGQTDRIDRDALIERVAAANPRTIVVLQSGGPVLTPWRDKVAALVEAWYPGQNGGTAIADVLLGDVNPSGRLPTTFPLREQDSPVYGDRQAYPGTNQTVRYKEGVLIGYRWFDRHAVDVAYPFGYGLSYTTFSFEDLRVARDGEAVKATVRVTNTGDRAGRAVPQLYVGMPQPAADLVQPPFQLKAFSSVALAAGESRDVDLTLDRRAFSYWSRSGWAVAPGCYRISVGANSRALPLRATAGAGGACAESQVAVP